MIVNLTSHDINIVDENNNPIAEIKPYGLEARVRTKVQRLLQDHDGVPLYVTHVIGEAFVVDVDGNEVAFPPSVEGRIFIVSGMFRSYYDRHDLWQPGRLVKNDDGVVVGCVGLSR